MGAIESSGGSSYRSSSSSRRRRKLSPGPTPDPGPNPRPGAEAAAPARPRAAAPQVPARVGGVRRLARPARDAAHVSCGVRRRGCRRAGRVRPLLRVAGAGLAACSFAKLFPRGREPDPASQLMQNRGQPRYSSYLPRPRLTPNGILSDISRNIARQQSALWPARRSRRHGGATRDDGRGLRRGRAHWRAHGGARRRRHRTPASHGEAAGHDASSHGGGCCGS